MLMVSPPCETSSAVLDGIPLVYWTVNYEFCIQRLWFFIYKVYHPLPPRCHMSTMNYLPHHLLKAYQENLLDDSKPLGAVFGAAFGISCLGVEVSIPIFVLSIHTPYSKGHYY